MIYTFYSYKGGVGRSMALANVAKCMATLGLRVVIVDWDLEAPGLESFFYPDQADREGVETSLGVLDLLLAYKQQFPRLRPPSPGEDQGRVLDEALPPARNLLIPVVPPRSEGSRAGVWLLPAGWRAGERFDHYARLVQGFDWEDLYASYAGAAYFDWLRAQLTAPDVADVVLVDSRTGITEMGGVCTRQLADVVVSFCAPNLQNLYGVAQMAQSFLRPELIEARGRRLDVVAVPTRLDNSEIDARNRFEERFKSLLDGHTPLAFRKAGRSFWDLRIPYIPKYAYEETLAVGQEGSRAEELEAAYQNLATQLLLLAPDDRVPRGLWGTSSRTGLATSPGDGPVVWNVPLPANPNFVNRAEELARMETSLRAGGRALPVVTVHGLRASGKTALVAEYVHGHRADYDVVWWVSARSRDDVTEGLTALAAALDLTVPDPDMPGAAREWLERTGRWLLVFDDVESPGVLEGFLPTAGSGHVIAVTTRAAGWRQLGDLVPVPMLTTEESVTFLARRTGRPESDDGLLALADALGGLPSALETAGALLETTGMTPAQYVAALDDPVGPVAQSQSELLAAFDQSLRGIESAAPTAAGLLHLYAQLESGGVPVDLLEGVPALGPGVAGAVKELTRSGLAQMTGDVLVVHPLLLRAARQLRASGIPWPDLAVGRVDQLFPVEVDDPAMWAGCERLVPYALISARRAGDAAGDARRNLLPRVARYLRIHARYAPAEDALVMVPPYVGGGESFKAVLEKGLLRLALGRLEAASSILEELARAPDAARRLLAGSGHGAVLVAQGEYSRAVSLLDPLAGVGRSAGGDEVVVAEVLSHLGAALSGLGRPITAEIALEQAIQIDDQRLAPSDPRRTPHLVQLGAVLAATGNGVTGRATIERGRLIAEAAFGPGHPLVADALGTLGAVLLAEGLTESARARLNEAVTVDLAVYGPSHPKVGVHTMLLGLAHRDLGDEPEARACLTRAVTVLAATVGERHPDAVAARDALESVGPRVAWRAGVAAALRRGYVADALVLIGEGGTPAEADRLRTDAADTLRVLGRLDAAQQLLERVLAGRPDDAEALYALARVHRAQTDTASAEARLRRAAELRRGDPDAASLLGRVDELRWRLRWELELHPEAEAAQWSDLAAQARTSYRLSYQRTGAYRDGVNAVALDALLFHVGSDQSEPPVLDGLRERIESVRAATAPGPLRTDAQKVEWLRATAALAELLLALGDPPAAARLLRSLSIDENLGFVESAAVVDRLELYGSLNFDGTSGFVPVPPPAAPRFDAVTVLLSEPGAGTYPSTTGEGLQICAGVTGADLALAEAARSEERTVRLLLPLAVEACRARLSPADATQFDELLRVCEVLVQPDRLGPPPAGVDPGWRSKRWALEMGRLEAAPGTVTAIVADSAAPETWALVEEYGAAVL